MCRLDSTAVQEQQQQQQHVSPASSTKKSLSVYFRMGRLRFGFHGVCASLAFCFTSAALLLLWNAGTESNHPLLLVYISVLFNTITAFQARDLLDQVPLQTEIVPGVVAPHRQAFQRTMSMMHYCNLRILECIYTTNHVLYKILLSLFILYNFLPREAKLDNGNTWIFVIPMLMGTTLDLLQYILVASLASIYHYLIIEWSALVVAFFFTLAFRGYFTVYQIYMFSAIVVATLFGGGLYMIVSSSIVRDEM